MNNIFENAKFGDKFKIRDGRMAIYDRKRIFVEGLHWVLVDGEGMLQYYDNGRILIDGEHPKDIVSRFEEIINDEELDDMATYNNPYPNTMREGDNWETYMKAFKTGYRKAQEYLTNNKK